MKRRDLDFVWLGGTDKIKEGTWSWTDGSPFEFTNWSRGEPNNWKIEPNEPDEDCCIWIDLLDWDRTEGIGIICVAIQNFTFCVPRKSAKLDSTNCISADVYCPINLNFTK